MLGAFRKETFTEQLVALAEVSGSLKVTKSSHITNYHEITLIDESPPESPESSRISYSTKKMGRLKRSFFTDFASYVRFLSVLKNVILWYAYACNRLNKKP
jgi:hypothetical protein